MGLCVSFTWGSYKLIGSGVVWVVAVAFFAHMDEKLKAKLDEIETQFVSDVDEDTLPSKPLMDPNTPGYVPYLENLK